MEIINKQDLKSKAFAINSIMKDPNLSKIIDDSWNSPVGSTKNNKAKEILKSLHKVDSNFNVQDGAGGPGDLTGMGSTTANPFLSGYNPYNIEASGTGMSQQYPEQEISEPNPNRKTNFMGSVDSFMPDNKAKLKTENKPTLIGDALKGVWEIGKKPGKFALETIGESLLDSYDVGKNYVRDTRNVFGAINDVYRELRYPGIYTPTEKVTTTSWRDNIGKSEQEKKLLGPFPMTVRDNMVGPDGKVISMDPLKEEVDSGGLNGDVDGTGTDYGTGDNVNFEYDNNPSVGDIFNLPTNEIDQWYNGLSEPLKMQYKDLYESVQSGEGAEAFSIKMLGNKEAMKTLGLPEEFISNFPSSGLLNEQLNDLRQETKDRFQLDSQLDMLLKMQNQSATIDNDLTAYIRGKDKYLGKVDDLLNEAKTSFAYDDTSDPYVAQRAQNYLNYLTVLKGRQNQRYTNFLDLAISSNTAQLQQAQSLYESTYAKANEAYQSAAALTTESYNSIKTMLKDLYNNIDGQTEKIRDNERYAAEKLQTAADLNKTLIDNYNEEYGETEDSGYDKVNAKYIRDNIFGEYDDKKAINDFATYDPMEIIANAERIKQNPDDALKQFYQLHGTDLLNRLKAGDKTTLTKYNELISELNEESKNIEDEDTVVGMITISHALKAMVDKAYRASVQSNVDELTDDDISNIRSMAKDILDKPWSLYENTAEDKADFVSQFSGVSKQIASLLFDQFLQAKEDDKIEPGALATFKKIIKEKIINEDPDKIGSNLNSLLYGEGA